MLYSIKCCKLNICLNIDKSTVVCCCRCAHVAHVYARPRMSYLWGARYESLGKFSLTSIFYNVVRTDRVGDASVSRARVEVRACMSEQCYCAVKLMLSFVFTPHPFSVSLSSPHNLPLEEVLRCLRLCCCFALYDLIMPNVDAIAASERGRVDLVALIEASGAHAVANLLQRLNHLRVNPSLMEMVRSRSYAAALWKL